VFALDDGFPRLVAPDCADWERDHAELGLRSGLTAGLFAPLLASFLASHVRFAFLVADTVCMRGELPDELLSYRAQLLSLELLHSQAVTREHR